MTADKYGLKTTQDNMCSYNYATSTKLWIDTVWRTGRYTKTIGNLKALVTVSPVLTKVNLCSDWTSYADEKDILAYTITTEKPTCKGSTQWVQIYGFDARDGVSTPHWLVKSMDSAWGSKGIGKVAIGSGTDNVEKGGFEERLGPFVSAVLFPGALKKNEFTLAMTVLDEKNCPWGIDQKTSMIKMEVAAKSPNAAQEHPLPLFALGTKEAEDACNNFFNAGKYRVESYGNSKLELKLEEAWL